MRKAVYFSKILLNFSDDLLKMETKDKNISENKMIDE